MKTITINVSEPIYRLFKRHAKQNQRTTSELIREAMEVYLRERIENRPSIFNLSPLSLGKIKKPWDKLEDLLEEMVDGD